ncbi:MAG: endonuclease/exonuclease/phosphatase family protein [Prolixibacteraceae bacterium]|nr:endonuclease/exonuclease/phosphatase family protein [Prolixibacteraceae bacterium]
MNLKKKFPYVFFVLLFIWLMSCSSSVRKNDEDSGVNIIFYNTENMFDTRDDPLTIDEEFLPEGERHWTSFRFYKKLNHISKAIIASCEYHFPEIVGLAEVENRFVLEQLTLRTSLSSLKYKIIHKDSPDERGIDVACLYMPEKVTPLEYKYYPILYPNGHINKTREILYVQFRLFNGDTLHLFFNHWPSRYGGQAKTENLRRMAAERLRNLTDHLFEIYKNPRIVIMGDFNDEYSNKSIKYYLKAKKNDDLSVKNELIDLSSSWHGGTLKYHQSWQIFDHIIVSDNLLKTDKNHLSVDINNTGISNLDFLLEPDVKYKGMRPDRTYIGFKYHGGFSDHLPVHINLN